MMYGSETSSAYSQYQIRRRKNINMYTLRNSSINMIIKESEGIGEDDIQGMNDD